MLASEFVNRKFGSLRLKTLEDLSPGSQKKVLWICDCGKEKSIRIIGVLNGHTKTCGKCNQIAPDDAFKLKFGFLRLKEPEVLSSGSSKKTWWVCDCGKESFAHIGSIVRGTAKSCGRCSEISAEEMGGRKFGRLKIKTPIALMASSTKKVIWQCDCGRESSPTAHKVLSLHTQSCGKCIQSINEEYARIKDDLAKLKFPIQPSDIPTRFIQACEPIRIATERFPAKCFLCSKTYYPTWFNIRIGVSWTCGCITNRVSKGQKELFDFLQSLKETPVLEYKLGKYLYDIWIPSRKLLIEFNGLKWHTGLKERDREKWQFAMASGCDWFSLFEDEWTFNRAETEVLLKGNWVWFLMI